MKLLFCVLSAMVSTAVLLSTTAASARTTETCLTGNAPDVGGDEDQIRAVRALVESTCVCATFDGSKGKTHAKYVKCALDVIKLQAPTMLRPQCKGTVKKYYSNSTCGTDPRIHAEPCVILKTLKNNKKKLTCTIKPTTYKKDGTTPNPACSSKPTVQRVGCANAALCIDVADTNDDLLIAAPADDGNCVPVEPDLVPTGLTAPPSGVAGGQSISVSYTVTNQADGRALSGWYDTIYLSTDAVLDSGDIDLTSYNLYESGPLAPLGGTYNNMPSVTIPGSTDPGSYYLIIATNNYYYVNSSIPESNETNNTLAAPITVTKPDLVPTVLTPPASGVAGQSISVSYTVANQGDGSAAPGWFDHIYLSADNIWDTGDIDLGGLIHTSALAPSGATYSNTTSLTIPGDTAPGSYYLIVYTDTGGYYVGYNPPGSGDVPEIDETNNTLAAPITVTKPDLVPTVLTPPLSGVAGQSISVSYTVANQGDGSAAPGWFDHIYLSADNIWDTGDIDLGGLIHTSALAPSGATYSNTTSLTIPGDTAPGSYYLIVYTDTGGYYVGYNPPGSGDVPEIDETNNTLAAPITVTKPDLVPTVLTPPLSGVAGQSISVSYTVENLGDGSAAPAWYDYFYLSTDTVLDPGDTPLTYVYQNSELDPSDTYTNTPSVPIPVGTTPGNYYLIVYTDANGNVPESNENNNTLAAPIFVSP